MPDSEEIRVSYLITTRNRADFLERTLANVREFLTAADELIVTDGASTDRTADVIDRNRDIITRFVSEPDFGEAHGYNKAILLSRGRIIKFITDDDYIYPEAMRATIDFLQCHPEVDALLCGGEALMYDALTQQARPLYYQHLPPGRNLRDGLVDLFRDTPCGVGLVLTRPMIARIGLLDTSYLSVDSNYMSRLVAGGVNFRYFDVKLFRQTVYPHSLQNDVARQQRDAIRLILDHRTWTVLLGQPLSAVADGLGLLDVPAGLSLMQWIHFGERLRQGNRRWVLTFLVSMLHSVFSIWDWAWRLKSKRFGQVVRSAQSSNGPLEPKWDGAIR